jgi:hypothetical protein
MSCIRVCSALLVGALLTAVAQAQNPVKVEVETLDNKIVKGELESIDAKEVSVKTANGSEKIPVAQILGVATDRTIKAVPKDAKITLVELTDGTILHCTSIDFKKNDAILKLTNGGSVTANMKLLKYVVRDAQDVGIQKKWEKIVVDSKGRSFDGFITRTGDGEKMVLNDIAGTIGDAIEEDGKVLLEFTPDATKTKGTYPVGNFQALLFVNGPPKDAIPQIFRLNDVDGNTIPVAEFKAKDDGYSVTTVGKVKIDVAAVSMAKMDFSKEKLRYLSDLDPRDDPKVECNLVPDKEYAKLVFGPVKDKIKSSAGAELLPIRMKGVTYKKGLSLHAHTELVYNVDSKYEWFKADLGFDDEIGGLTVPIIVDIYGDGKELKTITLNRAGYKEPEKLEINIKDVDRLIIKVRSGGALDSGWVEFGGARVTK